MIKKLLFSFVLLLAAYNAFAGTLSNIYILGTGGTIAGSADSSISSTYKSGQLKTDELLKVIPNVKQIANIQMKDLFHIDSGDISISHWIKLAKEINQLALRKDVDGIVITHGTDTMEETAYFLNLVIKTEKPVVLVGAMRPSTSMSADGPLNLYNAIAVAASKHSIGHGVLVVMNDQIFNAREVSKTNTTKVDAFKSPNTSAIGTVNFGDVNFYKDNLRKHTINTPFDISNVEKLPRVEIIYEYAGTNGELFQKAIHLKDIQGIIIAGSGDGNISQPERNLLEKAREKNIIIVRSSRTGSGSVTYDYVQNLDSKLGLVPADNLNPQKARILLMLSLLKTHDPKVLNKYFSIY